jgi:hypothetical protein
MRMFQYSILLQGAKYLQDFSKWDLQGFLQLPGVYTPGVFKVKYTSVELM